MGRIGWVCMDVWKSLQTKEHSFAMLIKVWNKNDKNRKIPRKLHFVSSLAVPRSFSGPVKSRPPVNLAYIHFPTPAPFQWIFQTLFELHFLTDSFFNSYLRIAIFGPCILWRPIFGEAAAAIFYRGRLFRSAPMFSLGCSPDTRQPTLRKLKSEQLLLYLHSLESACNRIYLLSTMN